MEVNYYGSPEMQTSTANEEVIPTMEEWSYPRIRFKDFGFMNNEDCTVSIQGSEPIFLRANQGFEFIGNGITYIDSFIVIEAGIPYQIIGRY